MSYREHNECCFQFIVVSNVALHRYRQQHPPPKRREGELVGESAAQVRSSLRRIGLQVIELKPVRNRSIRNDRAASLWSECFHSIRSRIDTHCRSRRVAQRAELYDGLATMLSAGVPLLDALQTLIESRKRSRRSSLTIVLTDLREQLRSGKSLAIAMNGHPDWFDAMDTAIIEAGHPFHFVQGAALLIVLATLVIVTSAVAMLAGTAASIRTRANVDHMTMIANELLVSAENPIQHWLFTTSAKIVLPPESLSPCINVLHDRFRVGDLECELQINAWDQFGMVSLESISAGSPLRRVVNAEFLDLVDSIQLRTGVPAGLDLYIGGDEGTTKSPFPQFGEGQGTGAAALGEFVAMHNLSNSINVNTAPIELVKAALSAAQRDGLDQIIAARVSGKLASVPAGRRVSTSTESIAPQLVGSSNVWSFRIDVRVGPVRKSWWATYSPVPRGRKSSSKSGMECVQRLVISH